MSGSESEGHHRLNFSALVAIFESYSADEQQIFLTILNITRLSDLYEVFNSSASNDDGDEPPSKSDYLTEYLEYRVHKLLLLYVPPIVFLLGMVGNFLSFLTLNCRAMRRLSTCAYLSVLAVADSAVLVLGLLRIWIAELTGTDVRSLSEVSCKATNAFGSCISDFSVWLIMAVTVERFVVVCYPLKVPSMCSRRRALWIMGILLATLASINAHFFWTTGLSRGHGRCRTAAELVCDSAEGYEFAMSEVWPWIDAFLYSLLPFVVILAFNVIIVIRVLSTRRHREELCGGRRPSNSVAESTTKLSVMLLTVSFAFVATTLPMNVTLIASSVFQGTYVIDRRLAARFKLARTVCELLMYANHSTNFFLYCATGNKFRKELCAIVRRRGDRGLKMSSAAAVQQSNEAANLNRLGVRCPREFVSMSRCSAEYERGRMT